MCATCISNDDAPPVPVLIDVIKRQRRRQRRTKWTARVAASICGFFVCFFTLQTVQGAPYFLILVLTHLFLAWRALSIAERVAGRLDHTKKHLRLTEALQENG